MERLTFNSQDEWKAARRGLFTSSEISRLMQNGSRPMTEDELNARPKSGKGSKTTTIEDEDILSEGALTYIREKIAEILAEPKPDFMSWEMERGKEEEPKAVLRFAEWLGFDINDPEYLYAGVADPIFYKMANIAGGTPDMVLPEAIAEIKCPNSTTHLQYLVLNADTFRLAEPDYWIQMQCNMIFCERPKCYFISYDDRFKDEQLKMKVIEIEADYDYQEKVVKKLALAKSTMDGMIQQLFALNPTPQAA